MFRNMLRSQNHHMIHILERTCQMCNLCNNRSFTDHELFVNILSYHTNLGSTNDCGCIWLGIIPTHSPTGLMIRYQLTIQTQHSVLLLSPKNVVKIFDWRSNTLRYLAICICQPSGTQSQWVEVGAWGWVAT